MQITQITNITDVPGPKKLRPEVVDLFSQSLSPGDTLQIPNKLLDHRLHRLANETGKIWIGALPAWYIKAKLKPRLGKTLTTAEARSRLVAAPSVPKPQSVLVAQPKKGAKGKRG